IVVDHQKKCQEYWPKDVGATKEFGAFVVTTVLEDEYADYAYRKLRVSYKKEERVMHHFHFLSWTDKSRPDHTFPLLAFLRRVRSFDSEALGPLVVHCSAGVGRTGTLIALDYLMEQAKAEQKVDVFSCVQKLREQRMNMVQLLEQYVFVYDALLETLKSGDTVIPCATFPHTLEDLKRSDSAAHKQMRKEFELIRVSKEAIDLSKADGGTATNKDRNRYQDIVPMDLYRPRLDQLFNDHGDYINAVSVDGYKSRDAYILTQMPLPETVSDFLHMTYNSYGIRSNAIVMLNELDEDDLTCATYWPTEVDSPVEFGGLTVSLVSEDKQQHRNIIIRDLDISTSEGEDKQPHRVRQFQMTNCWSKDSPFPKEMGVLLDLMELVTRWQQQSEVAPVTVHCLNGVERSAMFAMASYLVDMLKVEQIVDVYLACRFITSKCPLALPSLEQYQFLFELAGSFMSDFETYSNFK
ncbi:hypothetical protein CAPTEDRAFT_111890, partial [Capitella teleta]|uniref:protein-tyrosine-phosphatase n=1 Tax=Capitella teleta TaxID=283909 RepID=X1YV72_CAPTE